MVPGWEKPGMLTGKGSRDHGLGKADTAPKITLAWCGTGRVPRLALNDTLGMKVRGCLGLLIPRQNKDPFLLFSFFFPGFLCLGRAGIVTHI